MAPPWRTSGEVERLIDAPADDIYRVITDVTSTGERSEECRRVKWLDDSPQEAVHGARFRGYNRAGMIRWNRVCEVLEAEEGRVFSYRTVPNRIDLSRNDSTTWRYELEPHDDGTLVRHSYEITKPPMRFFKAMYGRMMSHHRDMRPAMEHTLEALDRTVTAGRTAS